MDLVTAPAAVLCKTPFQLEEAARAGDDEAWLKQIACLRSPAGVPALRIDPAPIPDLYQPWQVRLQVPGAAGITLWGYHWSFTSRNGVTMMELYRARTAPRR